eukprot:9894781-Prorocentrum_lima.AAC.1
MTSSLVGSEMCIRDRQPRREELCSGFFKQGQLFRNVEGSEGEPKQGPVSYTHLTLPTICSV